MFSALFRNRGKHINFPNATDDDDGNRIRFLTKKNIFFFPVLNGFFGSSGLDLF
jgi:hypothetical protein